MLQVGASFFSIGQASRKNVRIVAGTASSMNRCVVVLIIACRYVLHGDVENSSSIQAISMMVLFSNLFIVIYTHIS